MQNLRGAHDATVKQLETERQKSTRLEAELKLAQNAEA